MPPCSAALRAAACQGPTARALQSSPSRCSRHGKRNREQGPTVRTPVPGTALPPPASAAEQRAGASSR